MEIVLALVVKLGLGTGSWNWVLELGHGTGSWISAVSWRNGGGKGFSSFFCQIYGKNLEKMKKILIDLPSTHSSASVSPLDGSSQMVNEYECK